MEGWAQALPLFRLAKIQELNQALRHNYFKSQCPGFLLESIMKCYSKFLTSCLSQSKTWFPLAILRDSWEYRLQWSSQILKKVHSLSNQRSLTSLKASLKPLQRVFASTSVNMIRQLNHWMRRCSSTLLFWAWSNSDSSKMLVQTCQRCSLRLQETQSTASWQPQGSWEPNCPRAYWIS